MIQEIEQEIEHARMVAARAESLKLSSRETQTVVAYLTGARPETVASALDFIKDQRAQEAAWKSCSHRDDYSSDYKHERDCPAHGRDAAGRA